MKVMLIAIAVLMILSLCSCGAEEPTLENSVMPETIADEKPVKEPVSDTKDSAGDTAPKQITNTEIETETVEKPKSPATSKDADVSVPPVSVPSVSDNNPDVSHEITPEPEASTTVDTEAPEDMAKEPEPEPEPEVPAEVIDTEALEAYGRSYASSTYGYWGNPNTGFSSNAGYFPPTYVIINSMEEGYKYAREVVDAQYCDDIAVGQPITAEIDGETVHRKINIYFQATDDPSMFLLYCFYGGE